MSISEGQGGDCCLVTCRREPAVALSIENTHAHSKAQKKKIKQPKSGPSSYLHSHTSVHNLSHMHTRTRWARRRRHTDTPALTASSWYRHVRM